MIPQKTWLHKVPRLVTSPKTGDWCQLPYPGHKRGCPNYGDVKHAHCPPHAPSVKEYFDLSKPMYFVHSDFNLEADIERRRKMTPGQTERQYRCVLYWQSRSRQQLKIRVKLARYVIGSNAETFCPEGMGVNVYATARLSGLYLERIRDLSTCRRVALLGWK